MSEFHVEVVKLEKVERHPNADTLSVAHIHGGYPVCFKTESFAGKEKAVYIPIDALVPLADPLFSFLSESKTKTHQRIRAKKLRGIFSMGMLIPALDDWEVGRNVQEILGIEKWEPAPPKTRNINSYSEQESDPGIIPVYTDLESLRKYHDVLQEGEEVVITEKIHGANARFVFAQDRLWVGSHRTFKKSDHRNMWWQIAASHDIEKKLYEFQDVAIYGEVYGNVQDLKYGAKTDELMFAAYDVFDCKTGRYLDYDKFKSFCNYLEIPMAPELYRGKWYEGLWDLAEGQSTIANHVKEGFVVKPVVERWHEKAGRLALKLVGKDYLLRKENVDA